MRSAAVLTLLFAFVPTVGAQGAREARLHDASLRAVQFLEKEVGWAVGDEGVILNTIDGGKTWDRKPTGLRASLRSVCFLTPFVGWVVGREELPGGMSAGVLLYTRDGGESWKQLLPKALPGLNQVRFVDAATGFVLGDGCEQFPSGLFRTDDGGRTWEPVAGPRATSWLAGEFQDGKTGVLTGAWSRLATFKQGEQHSGADVRMLAGRQVHAVQVVQRRLLAGAEGGLILTSGHAGASWGFADLKLPTEILPCLDFRALHAVGARVWAVGRPGSVVLHSADGGSHWQLLKTGQPLPLHGVFFFNDRAGWAVGDGGTILATSDGGQSWRVQRQGGKRAAVLIVQAHVRDLPADTLAVLGASDGYLATALRMVAPEPASAAPSLAQETPRYAAAVRGAGGMVGETAWAFPLPQYLEEGNRKQVLAYWDRLHAGRAERELVRQLVLALRIWRPSVVLGDHPENKGAPRGLVAEALQEAVRLSADAQAFPEQLVSLGLQPWQVGKTYGLWDKADASVVQDNHEPRPSLGATAAEAAGSATLLLTGDINRAPDQRYYRLIQGQVKGAAEQRDWMLGLSIDEGDGRRARGMDEALSRLQIKAIRERRSLLALADQPGGPARLAEFLRHAEDSDEAAATAFAVGSQYVRRGQWVRAEEAFLLMVERYPAHPLAAEAYRWLIRHSGSSEARHRHNLQPTDTVAAPDRGGQEPKIIRQTGANDLGAEVKGGLKLLELSMKERQRSASAVGPRVSERGCLEFGRRLASFGPLYASDPALQFCLQAAQRQRGEGAAAEEWYTRFQKYVAHGPWADAARAELWLNSRAAAPPRRVGQCRLTETRPHLDGVFDDACWRGMTPLRLENAAGETAGEYPTEAMCAYDQEFFYLALRCRHPRGHAVPPVKARGRDADLEGYDRVSLLLDLDRDYATYYHLQVDQRGCVREDCWGDTSWNPRWFVAVSSDAECWQVEAAIPLGALTSERIALGSAWAFNVVRIVPGHGVQSWSQPADVRPRLEGMSPLLFQQDPARAQGRPMPPGP
jgi:photosystem II stability/assembly factor-like uncharacterized protein